MKIEVMEHLVGVGFVARNSLAYRLSRYTQHEPWCRTRFDDPMTAVCSCGLAELLAEAAKEK